MSTALADRLRGREYLDYGTLAPAAVRPGRFLVHNHVRPAKRAGTRGFRVWLQPSDTDPLLEVCQCDYAAGRPYPHYRVVRA